MTSNASQSINQTNRKVQQSQQHGEVNSGIPNNGCLRDHYLDDTWTQKYNIYERALSALPLVNDKRKEHGTRTAVCVGIIDSVGRGRAIIALYVYV